MTSQAKSAPLPYNAAAVMGDLVDSESAQSKAALHQAFNDAVAEANREYRDDLLSPLTITLGDEFQGLAIGLKQGVTIVRALRQRLLGRQARCRFVVGLVAIESPINAANAWNMMGAGLAEVRDKLNNKRSPNAYRFELPEAEAATEALMQAVGHGLTLVEEDWSERQREVVSALRNAGADVVGAQLGITTGSVYKIRRAARLEFYQAQWDALLLGAAAMDEKYLTP